MIIHKKAFKHYFARFSAYLTTGGLSRDMFNDFVQLQKHFEDSINHLKQRSNIVKPLANAGLVFKDRSGVVIESLDLEILHRLIVVNTLLVESINQEKRYTQDDTWWRYRVERIHGELGQLFEFFEHVSAHIKENNVEIKKHLLFLQQLEHESHDFEHNFLSWFVND